MYSNTRDGMLHMVFKLGQCAQENWRKLGGFDTFAKVITGVKFKDGIETTKQIRLPHDQKPPNTRFDNNSAASIATMITNIFSRLTTSSLPRAAREIVEPALGPDPKDNAMVRTVFKTIKSELVWRTSYKTTRQAEKSIGHYIDGFNNPQRRHSAIGYKSPIAFEATMANTEWTCPTLVPLHSCVKLHT